LEATEGTSLFGCQVWAGAVEPGDGLMCNSISIGMVDKREVAMGDQVGEDEGRGFFGHSGDSHDGDRHHNGRTQIRSATKYMRSRAVGDEDNENELHKRDIGSPAFK
jgi:hypothetical protein